MKSASSDLPASSGADVSRRSAFSSIRGVGSLVTHRRCMWLCAFLATLTLFCDFMESRASGNGEAVSVSGDVDKGSWGEWWRWHRADRSPRDVCPFTIPEIERTFIENRPKLFSYLIQSKDVPENAVILLPTATRPIRDESDSEFAGWRQTPNVQYLVGPLLISGAAVTLNRVGEGSEYEITIYLPSRSQRESVFTGALPSAEELKRIHNVSHVRPMALLAADTVNRKVLTTVSLDALSRAIGSDALVGVGVEYSEAVRQAFHSSRFIKSDSELALVRYSSRVAAWAHKKVAEIVVKAKYASETDVMAEFVRLCALCGGTLQAYPAIVGSGSNSAVLHYRTGEDLLGGHKNIAPALYVLIDAAPEYAGYASDVTRTLYRRGQSTEQMREVWGIVSAVQKEFIGVHYREGASWQAINALAMRSLTRGLVDAGFLLGDVDELMANGAYSIFMPHGLGHPVGLEVHDPTPLQHVPAVALSDNSDARFNAFPSNHNFRISAMADYKVPRGHVTTVEPGVYFIKELLDSVRNETGGIGRFVNWSKIDAGRYVELGGVRIEDVVAVRNDGIVEVLSI